MLTTVVLWLGVAGAGMPQGASEAPSDPWGRPVEAYRPDLGRTAIAATAGANVMKDGLLDDHYVNGGLTGSRVWRHGFGGVVRIQANPVAHSRVMIYPGYTWTDSLGMAQIGGRYELDGGQGRVGREVRVGMDVSAGLSLARVRAADLDFVPTEAKPFVYPVVGAALDLDLPFQPGHGLRLSVEPFHSFGAARVQLDPGIRIWPRDRTGVRVMIGLWTDRKATRRRGTRGTPETTSATLKSTAPVPNSVHDHRRSP